MYFAGVPMQLQTTVAVLYDGASVTVTAVPMLVCATAVLAPVMVIVPAGVTVAPEILPTTAIERFEPAELDCWSDWYFSVTAVRAELPARMSSETRARIV